MIPNTFNRLHAERNKTYVKGTNTPIAVIGALDEVGLTFEEIKDNFNNLTVEQYNETLKQYKTNKEKKLVLSDPMKKLIELTEEMGLYEDDYKKLP